jgi:DNA-binding GntR family transcriptional regulator
MELLNRMGLTPIKQEPLSMKVANTLENMIYHGQLTPGTRLTEETIAQELGVSRIPVREAIRSLEKYGLVQIEPGQGAHVTVLTEQDIKDIFEVRVLLEVNALELCNKNNREKSTQQLQEQVIRMKTLTQEPGVSRFDIIDQDIQFDEILFKLCGNNLIYEIWEIVSARIRLAFSINPYYEQTALYEQNPYDQKIVDAMQTGDEVLAKRVLKDHLKAAETSILKALSSILREKEVI